MTASLLEFVSMVTVNVREAKTHLSRLLNRVTTGEEITIAKAGQPIARLVPVATAVESRTPGIDVGHIWISEDFDDPLSEDLLRDLER
jgi:prevent-host-death family protein